MLFKLAEKLSISKFNEKINFSSEELIELSYDKDTKKYNEQEVFQLIVCLQMLEESKQNNVHSKRKLIFTGNLTIKRPIENSGYDFEITDNYETRKVDLTLGNLEDPIEFIIDKLETKRRKSDQDILIFYITINPEPGPEKIEQIMTRCINDIDPCKLSCDNIFIFDAHKYFKNG
jgi:hypothetical protein